MAITIISMHCDPIPFVLTKFTDFSVGLSRVFMGKCLNSVDYISIFEQLMYFFPQHEYVINDNTMSFTPKMNVSSNNIELTGHRAYFDGE